MLGASATRSATSHPQDPCEPQGDKRPVPNAKVVPLHDAAKSKTPALDSFGRDLTELAKSGELDPVIGRQPEIERLDSNSLPPHQEQPRAVWAKLALERLPSSKVLRNASLAQEVPDLAV